MKLSALASRIAKLEANQPKATKPYKIHWLGPGDEKPECDPGYNHVFVTWGGCGGTERFPDATLCSPLGDTTGEPMFSTDDPMKAKPAETEDRQSAIPDRPVVLPTIPDLEPVPGTRDYFLRWGTRWPLNTD